MIWIDTNDQLGYKSYAYLFRKIREEVFTKDAKIRVVVGAHVAPTTS